MDVLLRVLEWTIGLAGVGYLVWHHLTRTEQPLGRFFARVIYSAVVLGFFAFAIVPFVRTGGEAGAFIGVPLAAGCFLVLGIIWRHELTDYLVAPLGNLFFDNTTPPDPKPHYAHVEAKRMAGDFPAAIAAVRAELEKFPNDFDGRMRLAALLAEHSEDLPGALEVIEDTLRLKNLAIGQIACALNTAADWHLKFARDAEAARQCVERITTLLAGTEAALHAQQRLANFATPEMLAREDNRQPIAIPEFERKLGLKRRKHVAPDKPDINAEERRLRDRLARSANDWVAREELARLYVEQFEFFERGLQELEILITTPGQPKAEVVRWLHQKADWQVKLFNDVEAGRATLKRIQELFPNSAAAHRAAVAMMHLQPISKFEKKKAEE